MPRSALAEIYSHPGFAPVSDELRGIKLRIDGALPAELDGIFFRNGANALFARKNPHMFDGEAMLHIVEIRDGEARYSNSILRTPRTAYIERRGRNPFIGLGDLTCGDPSVPRRMMLHRWKVKLGFVRAFSRIESVACGTSVLAHDDRLYCLQETGLPFVLDVTRDEQGWLCVDGSGRLESFDGRLASPFSAHPKHDWLCDEVHSIGNDVTTGTIRHVVIGPGRAFRSAVIAKAWPPPFYVHDFILTDRFLIFFDSSLRFDPAGLQGTGSVGRFDRDRPFRFGVIDRDHRDGAPVRWFTLDTPGHIWHLANGWEEGESIVIHAPMFRDYPTNIPIHTPAEPHAEFVRWRLDLASGEVVEQTVLLDHFYERPGLDGRRAGRRARFAWLLDEGRGGVMGKGTLKYDLLEGRPAGYVDYGDLLGGEPLFVPRSGDGAEDDGWLLDLLSDGVSAALIVVDARTMTEVCRIHMPRRVPFGVHGLWLDRAQADALITA